MSAEAENNLPILLVVDDLPDNIRILKQLLLGLYRIRPATNGKVALQAVLVEPLPDLILLDIMMPEMDGYEVCRQLKTSPATREIPVVFVTAKTDPGSELDGLKLGAVDYISKPFNAPIIQARIKTHLTIAFQQRRLQRQNEELIQAEKLKQDVERMSRHDMKSPLNGIIGYSSMLLENTVLTAEQQKYALEIRRSGITALHMINLSLGLYRMESGTYHVDTISLDLMPIFQSIKTDLQTLITGNRLTLKVMYYGVPVATGFSFFVLGEEILCYSMLANLIKNALEASLEGESVTIEISANQTMAEICIHNDTAVPTAMRDCFFEKYATAGKVSGTGLGTYSAKLIVETLSGTIQMHSDEEIGTTVIVHLPVGKQTTNRSESIYTVPWSGEDPATLLSARGDFDFFKEALQHLELLKDAITSQTSETAIEEIMWFRYASLQARVSRVATQSLRMKNLLEMECWDDAEEACRRLEQIVQTTFNGIQSP